MAVSSRSPSFLFKTVSGAVIPGAIQNSPSTGGRVWAWGIIPGLALDDTSITPFLANAGANGKSLFAALQGGGAGDTDGASMVLTMGPKSGAGNDGSLSFRQGLLYIEPQNALTHTYLTIDSGTTLATEVRLDLGSSLSTGLAISYGGAAFKALVMNTSDPAEFVATAAAGKPTYLRTQSGADNGAGVGYAGADFEIRSGDGGDGTGAPGGAAGIVRVVCGSGGSGTSAGARGKFQVWNGAEGANDYVGIYHDSVDAAIYTASGTLYMGSSATGTGLQYSLSTTALAGNATNTYALGSASLEWLSGYFGEDTVTGPVSTSGLYLGLAQEARLRWNKDATGYPVASLILGLNAVGSAASDRLALSAAAITGFAAASVTAGGALFAALQNGGAAAAAEGFAGASGTLTAGAGSNAVLGVGGAGGGWSLVASAGGTGTTTGGAGGTLNLTAGAGATGGTAGGAGGNIIATPGALGTGGGAATAGKFIIRQPGGSAGTDEIWLYDDGSKTIIDARNGVISFAMGGASVLNYNFSSANRWYCPAHFHFADQIGSVYGAGSDWAVTYDETTTDSLLFTEGSVGALALKGSAISEFTAASATAGNALFLALQTGGATSGTVGYNGASCTLTTGAGSNSANGNAGDAGSWNFVGAVGGNATGGNGGAGGGVAITLGAPGTGGTPRLGGAFTVTGAAEVFSVSRLGTTTLTPTAAVVGLTLTAALQTNTAGVLDLNCTVGATGVVGIDISMTTPAAGLGSGESMYAHNVALVGDAQDDAAAIVYGLNFGWTANGGAATARALNVPATFTYGLYSLADIYLGAADLETDTTTGMKIATGATQKLGFFGQTPRVQCAKTDFNNWAAFGDVVSALVALGLFDAA